MKSGRTFLQNVLDRRWLAVLALFCMVPGSAAAQTLVASYPFNGNANDASGNGNNGSLIGNPTLTYDRFGNKDKAYSFDGMDDYISVAHSTDFDANNYSISAWIKVCEAPPPGNIRVIAGREGTSGESNDNGYGIGLNSQNKTGAVTIRQENPFGVVGANCGSGGLADGKWHHVVVTEVSGTLTTYIDGVQACQTTGGFNNDFSNNNSPFYIGYDVLDNTLFEGAVDDIGFYDGALSSAQVQSLYASNGWPSGVTPLGLTLQAEGPTTFCKGENVALTAETTGTVAEFSWNPAGGLSDAGSLTPTASPPSSVTYTLTVYGPGPCRDSVVKTISIVIRDQPTLPPGGTAYVCTGDSILIGSNVSGGNGPYEYSWTPAEGLSDPTVATPWAFPTTNTKYHVTVTDANGCTTGDSTNVIVQPAPVLDLGPDTALCVGSPITIGAEATTGNPPYEYTWTPSDGLDDPTAATTLAEPSVTTAYRVDVKDASGCTTYDSIVVTVRTAPTADAGADRTLCRDSSTVLGVTAQDGWSYLWSPSDGLDDHEVAMPTATPAATTTYTLTVTNAEGCTATDEVTVTLLDVQLRPEADRLDFGELDGCTSSKELMVRLHNDGTEKVTIDQTTIDQPEFSMVGPARPFDIEPGTSVEVRVRFSPTGAGSVNGSLLLHGVPCGAEAVVALQGSKAEALVGSDLGSIEFGTMLECELVRRDSTFLLRNNGTAEAKVSAALVGAPFTVTAPAAFPATVPAGGTLQIAVEYSPAGAGVFADDLLLPYASGSCLDTIRIALSGNVVLPQPTADVTAIDFGVLSGCETSRDTTLELRNESTELISIGAGAAPGGFRVVGGVPVDIPPGESRSVTIRFEPTGTGNSSGSLRFSYEPCAGELAIALDGVKQGVSFALPDTVHFGVVTACDGTAAEGTAMLPITFRSDGSEDGSISGIVVDGPFIATIQNGDALPNGVEQNFELRFMPVADGEVCGWVDLTLEPCGVQRRVVLCGEQQSAALSAAGPVNFGIQAVGSTTQQDATFTNSGSGPITVGSIEGVVAPFSVVSTTPPLPVELQPGESVTVTVQFDAEVGVQTGVARAVTTVPCEVAAEAVLQGEGSGSARAVISLPAVAAAAGERVVLRIMLDESEGLDIAGAENFSARLRYEQSLLVPVDKSLLNRRAAEEELVITGTRTGTSGLLAEVEFIATLGSAEATELVLEDFTWTDASVPVATELLSGEFTLEGICRDGGVRLFDPSGEVALRPGRPNPARGVVEISYETVEAGRTELWLADVNGRRVATLMSGDIDAGAYLLWYDVSNLASGTYYCVMKTPSLLLTERLEVRK